MTRSLILGSILSVALAPLALAGHETPGGAKGDKAQAKGKTTLSGCLTQGTQEGVYTLKTKAQAKEVEVRGAALKEHLGHEVKLTGEWMDGSHAGQSSSTSTSGSTGSPAGSGGTAGTKETARSDKGSDRHFMVSNIEHIAAICTPGQTKP
jgi:hypothetical protein